MTPEGEVKAEIKKNLDWYVAAGECQYFMPVQTGRGKRAVDFLVNWKGRYVAIEAKAPTGGKLTDLQEAYLQATHDVGGVAIVARGWNDVYLALSNADIL